MVVCDSSGSIVPAKQGSYGNRENNAVKEVVENALNSHLDRCDPHLLQRLDQLIVDLAVLQEVDRFADRVGQEIIRGDVAIKAIVRQRHDQGGEEIEQDAKLPGVEETNLSTQLLSIPFRETISDVGYHNGHAPIEAAQQGHLEAKHKE